MLKRLIKKALGLFNKKEEELSWPFPVPAPEPKIKACETCEAPKKKRGRPALKKATTIAKKPAVAAKTARKKKVK
jgi:hypothetical protein